MRREEALHEAPSVRRMTRMGLIRLMIILSISLWGIRCHAQENICFSPRIKTLQVKVDGVWGTPSVMLLGGGHQVEVSFDDLQANHQRYSYTITHCNADWTPSSLLTGSIIGSSISLFLLWFSKNRVLFFPILCLCCQIIVFQTCRSLLANHTHGPPPTVPTAAPCDSCRRSAMEWAFRCEW